MEERSSTSTGYTGDSGMGMGGAPMMDQVKDQAASAMDQAKQQGSQMLDQAREQIRSTVSERKQQAAGSLENVASALRQSVDNLRTEQQSGAAGLLEGAAGTVETVSTYLREHDVEDLTRQVEEFGRRQPGVFLGAAFALGFMAARFLKSASPGGSGYGRGDQYRWSGVYGERSYEEGFQKSYYSGTPSTDVSYGSSGGYGAGGTGTTRGMETDSGYDIDEAADEQSTRSTLS